MITRPFLPDFIVSRVTSSLAVLFMGLVAWAVLPEPSHASKKTDTVPWSVQVQVHWGSKKNREAYRGSFERALLADLVSKACFQKVVANAEAAETTDLILEIQLNDLATEQDYNTAETMIPGQGEEHQLRSAKATVNLDYWLRPRGKDDVEILSGHIYREAVREPQTPTDAAEDRALRDLTKDASHWVVRDVCDRRSRLLDKVTRALTPKP